MMPAISAGKKSAGLTFTATKKSIIEDDGRQRICNHAN
jgi:hypothetical protein